MGRKDSGGKGVKTNLNFNDTWLAELFLAKATISERLARYCRSARESMQAFRFSFGLLGVARPPHVFPELNTKARNRRMGPQET